MYGDDEEPEEREMTGEPDEPEPSEDDKDAYRDEQELREQEELRAKVVPFDSEDSGISAEEVESIGEYDDDGCNVVDPTTGIRYFQCCSCGMVGDLEDSHSAGECNLCHAVNKDD